MTRELKLALIVGFALVLVVTVLISDHLSHARQAELAGNIPAEPLKVAEPPALSLGNETAQAPAPTVTESPSTLAGATPTPAAAPINLVGMGTSATPAPTPMAQEPMTINQGTRGNQVPVEHADLARELAKQGGGIKDNVIFVGPQPAMQTAQDKLPGSTLPPTVQPPKVTPSPTTVLPPVVPVPAAPDRAYTVAAGDNAFKIAKQFYGDGKVWRKLVKYNKLAEDGQLKVGTKLNIPTSETLLGKKAATASLSAPTPTVGPSTTNKPSTGGIVLTGNRTTPIALTGPVPSKSHSYTVKKGDTLAQIAQRELGSARRAHEILELNKKTIKDADSVPLGAVLTLPA